MSLGLVVVFFPHVKMSVSFFVLFCAIIVSAVDRFWSRVSLVGSGRKIATLDGGRTSLVSKSITTRTTETTTNINEQPVLTMCRKVGLFGAQQFEASQQYREGREILRRRCCNIVAFFFIRSAFFLHLR